MTELTIIVAASKNNVIGVNNQLPWRIPEDLRRFKQLTLGHPIIMGRKTHESIGKILPGRENIVLTRNAEYAKEGLAVCASLEEALEYIGSQKAFVIGGEQVYQQALPYTSTIELTRVHKEITGDAFFPSIDTKDWMETHHENHGEYSFLTYMRKQQ